MQSTTNQGNINTGNIWNESKPPTRLEGGNPNEILYQKHKSITDFIPAGSEGQILTSHLNSVPTWEDKPTIIPHLEGGGPNQIAYQEDVHTTNFIPAGTEGQILVAHTDNPPTWEDTAIDQNIEQVLINGNDANGQSILNLDQIGGNTVTTENFYTTLENHPPINFIPNAQSPYVQSGVLGSGYPVTFSLTEPINQIHITLARAITTDFSAGYPVWGESDVFVQIEKLGGAGGPVVVYTSPDYSSPINETVTWNLTERPPIKISYPLNIPGENSSPLPIGDYRIRSYFRYDMDEWASIAQVNNYYIASEMVSTGEITQEPTLNPFSSYGWATVSRFKCEAIISENTAGVFCNIDSGLVPIRKSNPDLTYPSGFTQTGNITGNYQDDTLGTPLLTAAWANPFNLHDRGEWRLCPNWGMIVYTGINYTGSVAMNYKNTENEDVYLLCHGTKRSIKVFYNDVEQVL